MWDRSTAQGPALVIAPHGVNDAHHIGFDEGPVLSASYQYLEERGVAIVRGVQREEARAVIQAYATGGGLIHNRQD